MSRAFRHVAVALASALALGACTLPGSSSSNALAAVASLSITTPLTTVACDAVNDCVAFGVETLPTGRVVTEAQTSRRGGPWRASTTNAALPSVVSSTACTTTTCLIAGADGPADALTIEDGTAGTLSAVTAPAGGVGVLAIGCDGDACALIDQAAGSGLDRFARSADAGRTWSTPVPITTLGSATVTGLACVTTTDCLLSLDAPGPHAAFARSQDGGATWSLAAGPGGWSTISNLHCFAQGCDADVTTSSGERLARSLNGGATWRGFDLPPSSALAACATLRACVSATAGVPARITILGAHRNTTTSVIDQPTPLVDLACDPRACVGVSATTLVRVTP